jgi:hypothetical protein
MGGAGMGQIWGGGRIKIKKYKRSIPITKKYKNIKI